MPPAAVISRCGNYRYRLTRMIDYGRDLDAVTYDVSHAREHVVTFVMLNPSTADATMDDPTIRRCIGFARRWGYRQLNVANLFAWRATDPVELTSVKDPVGGKNEDHVRAVVASSDKVICAWGALGAYMDQDLTTIGWMDKEPDVKLMCLGMTKHGHPRHPLYVPYSAEVVPFVPREMHSLEGEAYHQRRKPRKR